MLVPVNIEGDSAQLRATTSVLRQRATRKEAQIVAIIQANDDNDPMIEALESTGMRNVACLSEAGDLLEPMVLPTELPPQSSRKKSDDLRASLTSGMASNVPKAALGSQKSALHCLKWFHNTLTSTSNDRAVVARRSKLALAGSIAELLSALLFPPNAQSAIDPDKLAKHGAECVQCSPCAQATMLPLQLEQLLMLPAARRPAIDAAVISGEPCKASMLPDFTNKFPET